MTLFPHRLHHGTPAWVPDTAIFQVRIRCALRNGGSLIDPRYAPRILDSARDYATRAKWSCYLMLLMPDHVHALLGFGRNSGMSETLRNWKRGQTRTLGIRWQSNYFDHRIRHAGEYAETFAYIERNPVARGLCATPEDWAWRVTAMAIDAVPKF